MLAVLKKRWKPKRAAANNLNNNNNNQHGRRAVKSLILEPSAMQLETGGEKIRVSVSPRQVHPELCPAPNICVQGGRIEFIKPNQGTPDHVKEKLEARIAELEAQLEEEKRSTLRERRNTARFQALIEDRESLARDAEAERSARERAEGRLEAAEDEVSLARRRAAGLQESVNRLEESLRSMSHYKSKYAQLKAENAALNKTIESRSQQFQSALTKLTSENEALKSQLLSLETVVGLEGKLRSRLGELEQENAKLAAQRDQCEKCLDQVAHQVVQALLAQKGLREEITGFKEKVKKLEKENYTLSSLLLQRLPQPNGQSTHTVCVSRPASCDEARWRDSFLWLPAHRPCSLNLENPRLIASTDDSRELSKDEGYSTMSSEVQGAEEKASESPRRLARSSSEPALSEEAEWWEQVWLTDSRIDFDAPPELEEWTMDEIPGLGLSWLVEEEPWQVISPSGDSWSSHGTTSASEESKRSSTVSEGDCRIGTHFTSDFYRLVKFESTKSLASSSSRSQAESVNQEQSNLHLISEQDQNLGFREHGEAAQFKPSEISHSEDKESRGLLTVAEEEESLTSSISTPETVLQESALQEGGGVLGELEKFVGSDEEVIPQPEAEDSGCPTGWVHLATAPNLTDPKTRADFLDVMLSRSSSSCSSESGDDHSGYQHLHRLHRSRRHKKASASREGALRCGSSRASIIGREDLFLRFGAKEQEAVASFDFLEELTSASSRESTINPR